MNGQNYIKYFRLSKCFNETAYLLLICIFRFDNSHINYHSYISYLCEKYIMSTQDNYDRERGSKKPGKNARKKSMSRENAPLKNEASPKKPGRKQDPATKSKLKFDKDGKEIGKRQKTVVPVKKSGPADGIRLNKYIGNSGVCSRREADTYIATGLVTVNGKIINEMGHKVQLGDDVRF